MDKAQFDKEKEYGAALAIACRLLRRGLTTPDEHRTLTAALIQKYRPAVSSWQSPTGSPIPQNRAVQKKGGSN